MAFIELQQAQVERWLLNPSVYIVVALLLGLSAWRPARSTGGAYWRSVRDDYLYGVLYTILYFPLIAICVHLVSSFLSSAAPWLDMNLLGDAPELLVLLALILADDFLAYWSHRLRHAFRPLWHFHLIHHSQEHLNPLTTKRFHPVDNLFHKALILPVPMAVLGADLEVFFWYFLVDAAWDYFIHANLRVNLGPLRYLLVSPQFHRLHHSREGRHADQNFSDRLVLWDYLFGTANPDRASYPATGVSEPGYHRGDDRRIFLMKHLHDLWYPIRAIASDLKSAAANSRPPGEQLTATVPGTDKSRS